MADISMSYDAVSQIEEQASFLQTGFDGFIKVFKSTTKELMSGWEGKGKTDFAVNCDAMLPIMTAISDLLGKYSVVIGQAVYAQKSTDSAGAQSMKGTIGIQ